MTSIPDITRLLARIARMAGRTRQAGRPCRCRPPAGRGAYKLLDEVTAMLADVRRELLGSGRR